MTFLWMLFQAHVTLNKIQIMPFFECIYFFVYRSKIGKLELDSTFPELVDTFLKYFKGKIVHWLSVNTKHSTASEL